VTGFGAMFVRGRVLCCSQSSTNTVLSPGSFNLVAFHISLFHDAVRRRSTVPSYAVRLWKFIVALSVYV